MDFPGAPELIIIGVIAIALFGYKKLPDASRSIGRSLRIFKSEVKGMHEDDRTATPALPPTPAPHQAPPPVTTPVVSAPAPGEPPGPGQ